MKTMLYFRRIVSCLLMIAVLASMTACSGEEKKADDSQEKDWLNGIAGTWNEVSLFPRILTVNSDGSYTLADPLGEVQEKGKVTISYEEHETGEKVPWYDFKKEDGEFWTSFAVDTENETPNDLYSGQDGAMHFIREGSEKITPDDYLGNSWSYGRCYITIDKVKKNYVVSIRWSSSASESSNWTYNCTFDEEKSCLVCKGGAIREEVSVNKKGKVKSKTIYKDGSGSFVIKGGTLRWIDDKENSGYDMYFVKEEVYEEAPAE